MRHQRCYAHAMTMSTATRVFDARKLKGLKNISWLTSRQLSKLAGALSLSVVERRDGIFEEKDN
jgi:hypothetical protein